ncbi:sodium:solute symporter [Sporosarcina pasteurii]|uniref:Pantothenate permease n=2 Tax=Sporosarcina pasteurii TaxID=1474 RepID=A0A380BCV3_SPOPA|nr:sodium:solute symporter [Sporosarcina pasteurii]MDS9472626.1 sodium:solute symporter [Sporosarcina pasteurii]QBQ06170.1 sodium:solute symporter [Sporosarcina pasteurii]SUI99272.1 Pantothenate permease [Sporosarcina pasteurii]
MVTTVDVLVMILYLITLISIGAITVRKIKSQKDFLVAGSRLGYGLYVPAMAAVVLGGASTLGGSSLGYKYGISGMWLVVMIGLGILGMGFLFSKVLSKLDVFSVSELLGKRFDKNSRVLSAIIMTVYDLMVAVTGVIAMGVILSALLGWNSTIAIIVGGAIVLLYTTLGGMWAVTLTDVIQFWIMTIGFIFILLPAGLYKVGGVSSLVSQVDPSFLSLSHIGMTQIFSYFLLYFFGMMIGQDIWQRAFTAKNEKTLRRGTLFAGFYCIIYAIVGATIGMIASVLLPGLADPQQAIPQLATAILPIGLVGLILAAVASAIMSTASGTIMASATILVNDLILPFYKEERTEKFKLRLTRFVIMLVGIAAIMISAWLKNIIVALDIAYALLSGCIFFPVVAAFFWKRVSAKVVLISIIISSIVVISDLLIEGIDSLNAIIYGIIASGLTLLIGTVFFTPKATKLETS